MRSGSFERLASGRSCARIMPRRDHRQRHHWRRQIRTGRCTCDVQDADAFSAGSCASGAAWQHFKVQSLDTFGVGRMKLGIRAAGALMHYLDRNAEKRAGAHRRGCDEYHDERVHGARPYGAPQPGTDGDHAIRTSAGISAGDSGLHLHGDGRRARCAAGSNSRCAVGREIDARLDAVADAGTGGSDRWHNRFARR